MSVLLLLPSLAVTLNAPEQPIALHPENPHYFLWRGAPTVLVTSGEHYGALMNLDFDFRAYFRELEKHGLNHTRVFSGIYRESESAFGITDNTLAPEPGRYVGPWARRGGVGGSDDLGKFDLTQWNDAYFERLGELMTEAQGRGIVVEMTLFCTFYTDESWHDSPLCSRNNVNGVGDCPRRESYRLLHDDLTEVQMTFVEKMVTELAGFDNLYYEVCNEPYVGDPGCVSDEWQNRVIDTIVEMERNRATKHLISLNIANKRARVENPHPAVSILNFHYTYPPDVVAMNYHLDRAIGENETGFRGNKDLMYRTEAWDFLLAGGALYNNLDYSFTAAHPTGDFEAYASPGGGSRALREQLGILKRFVDGLDLIHMVPDAGLVRHLSPNLAVQALVMPGKAYAVYLHAPLPAHSKDVPVGIRGPIAASLALELPSGSYHAVWLDTKDESTAKSEHFVHPGGLRHMQSPEFMADAALRVLRDD